VIVELGAPLALLGRRLAYAWIALAWCFHAAVFAVMVVLFPYPLVGIAFASMSQSSGWRRCSWRVRQERADSGQPNQRSQELGLFDPTVEVFSRLSRAQLPGR
jgi:hypothetical protein